MSTCKIEKQVSGSLEAWIAKAKTEVSNYGGTLEGNTSQGSFSIPTPLGNVEGSYTINGATVLIMISEKPFVISCRAIENGLDKYLHRASQHPGIKPEAIVGEVPAQAGRDFIHWGDWKADACSGSGIRQYSSIIWGLDGYPSETWLDKCMAQPIDNIPGHSFSGPNRCKRDVFGHVWGEVDVPDPSCGPPPIPSGGTEIKQCALRDVFFQPGGGSGRTGLVFTINLLRTQQDQQMASPPCNCPAVLSTQNLFVRITALENNAPAPGRWYNNDGSPAAGNEFAFRTWQQLICTFVPMHPQVRQSFYANFFTRDVSGQKELVVAASGPYRPYNGGIEIPLHR